MFLIFSRLYWEPEVPDLMQAFGHANVTLVAKIPNYLMMNNFLRTWECIRSIAEMTSVRCFSDLPVPVSHEPLLAPVMMVFGSTHPTY
jgi:hypothetical protein